MTESSVIDPLSPDALRAADPRDILADALSLPDQLRDAVWKVESAGLTPWDSPGGLVIAGMGGSGIGGALAIAAIGDEATRPIAIAQGYELPSWTTPDTTVLCISYSGSTEETLACYEAAGVIGARRVVATTGGDLGALARRDGVPCCRLRAASSRALPLGTCLPRPSRSPGSAEWRLAVPLSLMLPPRTWRSLSQPGALRLRPRARPKRWRDSW